MCCSGHSAFSQYIPACPPPAGVCTCKGHSHVTASMRQLVQHLPHAQQHAAYVEHALPVRSAQSGSEVPAPCAGENGQLYTNMSAFQSAPDAVLQQQVFAACFVPAHAQAHAGGGACMGCMHDRVELLDATCDSDGVVAAHACCHCGVRAAAVQRVHGHESSLADANESSLAGGPPVSVPADTSQPYEQASSDEGAGGGGMPVEGDGHDCGHRWPERGHISLVALFNTGAYQDALASHHNLLGQPETWYVVPCDACGPLPGDGSGDSLGGSVAEGHALEECDAAAAEHWLSGSGMVLPPGWTKGRAASLRVMKGAKGFVAAVRAEEGIADMLHACGIDAPKHLEAYRQSTTYVQSN